METAQLVYLALVAAVAAQRVWELRISARHTAALLKRGGREVASSHYPVMAALHTTWLFACAAESFWASPPSYLVAGLGLALLIAGQTLRILAIKTLGERWTTRIIVLREGDPVVGGIFKYVRHPNYLGVIIEIAALPLIFGCWYTAVLFSLANGALLTVRIRAEEQALQEAYDYQAHFADTKRFMPGGQRS